MASVSYFSSTVNIYYVKISILLKLTYIFFKYMKIAVKLINAKNCKNYFKKMIFYLFHETNF